MKIGNIIEDCIKATVEEILENKELPDIEYIETDNLGEIIEKLIILRNYFVRIG